MLNTEKLYAKTKEIHRLSRGKNLTGVFEAAFERESALLGLEEFLVLIDEAKVEVETCSFSRPDKVSRYLNELSMFRATVLELLLQREKSSTGYFFNEGVVERIGAIADAVSEKITIDPAPIDRVEFAAKTSELIKEAKKWKADSFETRALLLALGLILDTTNSTSVSSSDEEIRRRINRVVAAFAVEFASMDKEFETRWETIKRWARLGYKGASTPLGLASDASAVAGLLPKP
jgi:hypothetical protein